MIGFQSTLSWYVFYREYTELSLVKSYYEVKKMNYIHPVTTQASRSASVDLGDLDNLPHVLWWPGESSKITVTLLDNCDFKKLFLIVVP